MRRFKTYYRRQYNVGDYLHRSGMVDNEPTKDVIAICVIPSGLLPDHEARFISLLPIASGSKSRHNWGAGFCSLNKKDRLIFNCRSLWRPERERRRLKSYGIYGFLQLEGSNHGIRYSDVNSPRRIIAAQIRMSSSGYVLNNDNFDETVLNAERNAVSDLDGFLNTQRIVEKYEGSKVKGSDKLAPIFCKKYNPGYGEGDWYLPSLGEASFIPGVRNTLYSRIRSLLKTTAVSDSFREVSTEDTLRAGCYRFPIWTSTEYSKNKAYIIYLWTGEVYPSEKEGSLCSIYPFIRK